MATEIEAINLLKDLKTIDTLLTSVEEDYKNAVYRAFPKGMSYDRKGSGGTREGSEVEEIAIEMERLGKQMNRLKKKYLHKKTEIYKILNRMDTIEYKTLILLHYAQGKTMTEVGDEMHYNRTWCFEKRREAIREFAEKMEGTA